MFWSTEDIELYLSTTTCERCIDNCTGHSDEPEKRLFIDVVPETFLNNSHPTITSGPSHNAMLQLTTIPSEIRAKIYPHLLCKTHFVDHQAPKEQTQVHVTTNRGRKYRDYPEHTCRRGVDCEHYDGYYGISSSPQTCSAVGPAGVINILLVCKQLYHEAVGVLYSGYTFEIEDLFTFRKVFVDHPQWGMGTANAQSIKHIRCKIPDEVKGSIRDFICYPSTGIIDADPDFESRVDEWTDVLCREFPALETLTCYSCEDQQFNYISHCALGWPEDRRGMLWTVAHVTKQHPKLKKAMWRAWSGWVLGEVGWFKGYPSRAIRFEIELTIASPTKQISVGRTRNIDGTYAPSKDIILDCDKIRSTSWEDLLCRGDWEYELPDNAEISEPSKIETANESVREPTAQTQFLSKWRLRRDARSEVATNPMNPKLRFIKYLGPKPKKEMIELNVDHSGDAAVELLEPNEEESESASDAD